MTEKPDLPTEMNVLLDDDTVEAILAGEANGSVPADFAKVAELARAARVNAAGAAPADSEQEQEHEIELVAAIAAAVRASSPLRTLRPRRRTRAAAVVAFAAVTFSATAAAAATNHLPSGLQDALSNAASHVGVHIPKADADRDQPASTSPASEEAPQQHDASASSTSDLAPPARTPADLNDDTPGNSGHDRAPGDVATEAHSDSPATEDDVHASDSTPDSEDHGSASSNSDAAPESSVSSGDAPESERSGGGDNSTHSSLSSSSHGKP